jgi:predicted AlkP superfamily phosphohydrolase/phosphomutase
LESQHPAYHSDEGARYRELLFSYYEKVDSLAGQLLARCDENTTVLVMSDHGFGSTRTSKYLTKLLMDEGLLRYRTGGVRGGLMRRLLDAYHTMPFLSALVRRLGGRQKIGLKNALARTALLPTPENIDWEHTQAFPGGYGLQVYINTRGRFAKGTVAPGGEYQALQAHIAERLLALTDPVTGEPIIKAVHRAQDIYSGPLADQSPDLIVEYQNVFRLEDGCTGPLNPGLEGNHVMEGIFIARGPQVLVGEIAGSQIIDLAPMILYLLGLAVPDDMDGRVLTEILSPKYVAEHPVQWEASTATAEQGYDYSVEEAELVREQLRALGYID